MRKPKPQSNGATPLPAADGIREMGKAYSLAVYLPGREAAKNVDSLREAAALINGKPRKADRALVVFGSGADLWVHLHGGETLADALEQSAAELAAPGSYFDVGFDSPEQEALARLAIPELREALKGVRS